MGYKKKKETNMKNRLFPVSMTEELRDKLKVAAEKEGLSMAGLIKRLLKKYLDK